MRSFLDYLAGVRAEMTHVKWPKNAQAIGYTAIVVVVSIITAIILGAFDLLFTRGIEALIGRF